VRLHRFSIKVFLDRPRHLDLRQLIPVFHEWITHSRVGGLLIDVADYSHIENGPGVVLVGHECDYRIEPGVDGIGLTYVDKARSGALETRLRSAFRAVLEACRTLESTAPPELGIRFRTDEARVTLLDRLHTPNDATTGRAFDAVLGDLFHPAEVTRQVGDGDTRRPLSVQIRARSAPDLGTLIARLA